MKNSQEMRITLTDDSGCGKDIQAVVKLNGFGISIEFPNLIEDDLENSTVHYELRIDYFAAQLSAVIHTPEFDDEPLKYTIVDLECVSKLP